MEQSTRLKATLEADLHTAMKARDQITTGTLRMALTAVRTEEVAGTHARELSDEEVTAVVAKEAKKRREAAEAFTAAGRTDLADQERAEEKVLARYLPSQLDDAELVALVEAVLAEHDFTSMAQMGPAMKAVQAKVAGRADGRRVAAEVRGRLTS